MIRRCKKSDIDPDRPDHKVCLYTKSKPQKLLGRHRSIESALRQERLVQMKKHGIG